MCYFLALDVLGFSRLVSNLESRELDQRIGEWVTLIDRLRTETGVADLQLLSDTVFVREHDSRDGLPRLFQFSRALLEHGIQRSFPVRGALTHGDVCWGRLTYGRPVIDAHTLERPQD